jgi:hypothetical protein
MWDVDGLGPARGFGGRLPSGWVVLLEELENAVKYHGAKGPSVYVDAAVLGAIGAEPLVSELQEALGLTWADFVCVADEAARKRAAELAARVLAAKVNPG